MKKLLHFSARLLLVMLACCFSLSAIAQKKSIQGTVVDETGAPLIGASVVVMSGDKILGGEQLPIYQVVTPFPQNQDRLSTSPLSDTSQRELLLQLRRLSTPLRWRWTARLLKRSLS